jgi:Domain of unknown function (DUF5666)
MGIQPHGLALLSQKRNLSSYVLTTLSGENRIKLARNESLSAVHRADGKSRTFMKSATAATALAILFLGFFFASPSQAQQNGASVQGIGSQAFGVASSNGSSPDSGTADSTATSPSTAPKKYHRSTVTVPVTGSANGDNNPFDPLLEPPPLPKGKPTLIGGLATHVDQVRNHLTIQPFGGGPKIEVFVDERSRIYRDGKETTVLGLHKGDRVYVDTMLDGSRIFAKNVRVLTQTGTAEMRGQILGFNRERGMITVRDQLSVQPINFAVSPATKYSTADGAAISGDLQPGSLVDVQFAANRNSHPAAQQIVVLAKPGDSYVFSGVVVNVDMRTNSLSLENRSDQQLYELHFSAAGLADHQALKVGSEVTARAIFDGKVYKASNLEIEKTNQQ